MTDTTASPAPLDFRPLGFVDDPFARPAGQGESAWVRMVGNAAANRLLAACMRARKRSAPVLVTMTEDVPDYYYRIAQNDLLARCAAEPQLGVMALNIPLEMMRLGRIRGTLAELSELVVAVDMPATLAAWYGTVLDAVDGSLPEAALVSDEDIAEARALFASDPAAAVERYFSFDAKPMSASEMDVVVHEAYLRQVGQPVEVEKEEESVEIAPVEQIAVLPEDQEADLAASEQETPQEAHVREYLLALARTRLSPVLARAFTSFGRYGEALAAQELKITKAPRKTLAALLRFMGARWGNIVVIYDSFDAWDMLDQKARVDVLQSLTELRYIIAEAGVMVVGVNAGLAPEIDEQFAAAEPVDWTLPEVPPLSHGERAFDAAWIQAWLDAAAIDGVSRVRADGAEFAPILEACNDDVIEFATMMGAAIRDAAARGLSEPDEAAIAAGVAAGRDEV